MKSVKKPVYYGSLNIVEKKIDRQLGGQARILMNIHDNLFYWQVWNNVMDQLIERTDEIS